MVKSDRGKRLARETWDQIHSRYLAGDQITELALEYGIARETISRRARKENWKKPAEIRAYAIEELQLETKEDYKEKAREANMQQLRAYQVAAGIIINLLEDVRQGKAVGRTPYEVNALVNSLKTCLEGVRSTLAIDGVNSPFTDADEEDESARQRLLKIMTPLPCAPSGLFADAIGPRQINLSWTDESGDLAGFRIERAEAVTLAFTVIGKVPGNTTGFSDEKVLPGQTYVYRVIAYDRAGDSFPSQTATATTPNGD
jgi:hypothetical protein